MPTLRLSAEKVCYVVVKARELEVKVAPAELDEASNASDDDMAQILEDYADDPTLEELRSFLEAMNEDEIEDLVALTWLGRDDYAIDDWDELLDEVREVRDGHPIETLLGTPLLAEYLEGGLAEFGLSCEEFELGHM